MTWLHIIDFTSILVTVAVMGFIAWYSRRLRDVAGSGIYMWIALLVCFLSILQGISMIGPSVEWARFWFNMRIACFATIPVLWLVFVLNYIGKPGLFSKTRVTLLLVLPIVTQIMLWTNEWHGLWVSHDVGFHRDGPFFIPEIAARVPGLWYKIHSLYTYGIMLAGIIILFVTSLRLYRQYRGQAVALGIGTLVIVVGTLFPVLNLVPDMELNPLPQSFAIGSLIIAWGMYRYRLFSAPPSFDKEKRIPVMLATIFVLMAGGIVFIGYVYYQQYEKYFRVEVGRQLSSIVDLKVSELVHWRSERLGDAAVLYGNNIFTEMARRAIDHPADIEAQKQVKTWLGRFQSAFRYDNILLLDTKGVPRVSVKETTVPVCRYLLHQIGAINRSGKVTFLDFHRDAPDKPIHLSIVAPMVNKDKKQPIGFVVFHIDPAIYLYPLINRWPTAGKTGETLLVRREGNEVLFLNELKFMKNTALNLRLPIEAKTLPAAQAVLGVTGLMEGIDYRGMPVIAALSVVPNSPWFLVARMDKAEVYAPIRERLWLMIALVFVLLAGAGAGIGMVWQIQKHRFYREQYESAEALRTSGAFLDSIIEHSPHSLWISDEKGTLIRLNQACRDLLNIADDEVVGKYNLMEDSILEKQGFIPLVQKVFEKGETARFTLRYDSADLESLRLHKTVSLILEVTISPVLEGKRVIHAIIQHVNVTERKLAEESLRKSEAELAYAQEIAHIGSWRVIFRENVKIWSSSAELYRIYNYPLDIPLTQQPGLDKIHPDDREPTRKNWLAFLRGESPGDWEHRIVVDGRTKWIHVSAHVEFDKTGKPLEAVGTCQDITDRKLAAEAIHVLNEELEQKVAERTKELHESQLALLNLVDDLNQSSKGLASANDALDAVNKELASFSYSVSHDLRAPLRSIDGFSQALLEDCADKLDDDGKKYLDRIRQATQNMGRLIDDMLNLSRVTQSEFCREEVDLSKMVREITNANQWASSLDGSVFSIQEDIIVRGDQRLMLIALTNLLDNAWKFAGKRGHPHIEFGSIVNNGKRTIFVRDNGVGFDMKYAGKLFGTFQRLHRADEFPGTGIGLATVMRVINRHGGQIWAESEVGKGATFYFTLPE